MEQSNQSKKVLLSVIGVAILVVAVVGVSFAFFSYTRGGAANQVETGTIVFSSTASGESLENAFPVATSVGSTAAATIDNQVAVSTVSVKGNTTYASGISFRVVVAGITLPTGTTSGTGLPINIRPRLTITDTNNNANITMSNVYSGTGMVNGSTLDVGTVVATGTIAANAEMASETEVLKVRVWYDLADYHISDNTKSELVAAGLLDNNYNGTIVPTEDWNGKAFSITLRVDAVEGGSTFTARNYS